MRPRPYAVMIAAALAVPTVQAQQVLELVPEDHLLAADFEEVMRVGAGPAEWEALVDVVGVAFDESGNLFIADLTFRGLRILIVSPSGELMATFGRRGDGPGEWRGPVTRMIVFRDGRVVVPDPGHQAYHLFGSDGRLERMVRFPDADGGMARPVRRGETRAVIAGQDGTLFSRAERVVSAQMDSATFAIQMTEKEGPRVIERVLIDGDEARHEPVVAAWTPPGADRGRTIGFDDEITDWSGAPPALLPKLLFVGLPGGGVVYTDSTDYSIKLVGHDGRLERVLRRAIPQKPVNQSVRRAYRRWRLDRLEAEEDEEIATLQRETIERLEFYHEVPMVDDLRVTWDGALWVLRTPEDGFPWETDEAAPLFPFGPDLLRLYRDPSPIDVIAQDGRYVGTFPAGETDWPVAFGPGGLAAYVELDDLDVPTVIVRRLPEVVR